MHLVDRTLFNPSAKPLFLVFAKNFFRRWWWHYDRLIAGFDASDQFTFERRAWDQNPPCGRIIGNIESEVSLPMAGVWAMAGKTELGQDRSYIAIELQVIALCFLT
jgi:hypothetical protein